ncbi:hypothetical protein VTH06DRAFT_5744 [Thermothelomyces fergusii]
MAFSAATQNKPSRSRRSELDLSPASSRPATPPCAASPGSSTFLTSSVSNLWGGFMRRFSGEPSAATSSPPGMPHAHTFQADGGNKQRRRHGQGNGVDGVYTPPHLLQARRTASPMRPPPLEPLRLTGFSEDTRPDARLLTAPIAEEIRIMVPARLGIVDEWKLVYSLEQDGASLATLYEKCAQYQGVRVGFVLCVKDCDGGLFGAYLSDYPHPAPKYFGTGECFLWRASVLSPPPPPPSTTDNESSGHSNLRTSTVPSTPPASRSANFTPNSRSPSRSPTPQQIRFKAFPYSGVNDYYMLCEPHFLSLGAGDGKYGLWLDDSLERGISATSQTFGNEPLSDEGEKFGVLGVEVWVIGA